MKFSIEGKLIQEPGGNRSGFLFVGNKSLAGHEQFLQSKKSVHKITSPSCSACTNNKV